VDPWGELDEHLRGLLASVGGRAYVLVDSRRVQLLPFAEDPRVLAELASAYRTLASQLGGDFVGKAKGQLECHDELGNGFIVLPFLSTYLLIVLFAPLRDPAPEAGWTLRRAAPVLGEMIGRLPPDGGRPAASQAHRRR
jgi:hypothetical protein